MTYFSISLKPKVIYTFHIRHCKRQGQYVKFAASSAAMIGDIYNQRYKIPFVHYWRCSCFFFRFRFNEL